jgi:glycosyltransferase involved in cell wall biosynthesis
MGLYFYPRGGSAQASRALARALEADGLDVTLVAGSRSDLGDAADAVDFYAGLDLRPVDYTPALGSTTPLEYTGAPGTAPIHGSYEDRPGSPDRVLASLDDKAYELQVEAWMRELEAAAAPGVDVAYLHHLTPLNEAVRRLFGPELPVVGHVHGTELLMLEEIEAGPPPSWTDADAWAERLRRWARECQRIVVNDPGGLERAARLLGLPRERFACVPNGFDPHFAPAKAAVDRAGFWRRILSEEPRGWRPDGAAGSVAYSETELAPLAGTVFLYVGRFTAVKRLPLLIEAFIEARTRLTEPSALVLLGGHPGEWEGEHPTETIARLGAEDVFLAGWHPHSDLPNFMHAADAVVHASPREAFGQVLVEGMACELPAIAVDRGGPARIVTDPATGWLVPPEDPAALAAAIAAAALDPAERQARGTRARQRAVAHYSWDEVGTEVAELVRGTIAAAAPAPSRVMH